MVRDESCYEHYSDMSPDLQERIALLLEESGEIVQACGKILRHGMFEGHHKRPDITNKDDLEKEIAHVWLAIEMLTVNGDIDQTRVIGHMYKKAQEIDQYLHHQPLKQLKEIRDRFTVGGNSDKD